ncbi:hypothetical protein COLO4_38163 [Corchorus olitorius]|uniref:Uncharacterized protein n=1 Tax=Corchorus olitorius TaxID=93759 RepID=A0A1R3FX06_9ROSI|nr:hypothetical protein COLO4_38163 [Corchorus olitorius]
MCVPSVDVNGRDFSVWFSEREDPLNSLNLLRWDERENSGGLDELARENLFRFPSELFDVKRTISHLTGIEFEGNVQCRGLNLCRYKAILLFNITRVKLCYSSNSKTCSYAGTNSAPMFK